jgi:hypothetical protein
MSFYGLVLIICVLFLSFYLSALMHEANSLSWISAAYEKVVQAVQTSVLTPIKIR